jgi:hypothetical protein
MENDDDDKGEMRVTPYISEEQTRRILHNMVRASRSSCFWWFYDHYENMRNAEGKLRQTWPECAASLNAIGVTATRDRPLTSETARRTWLKVVEKKERDAARGIEDVYAKSETERTN